MMHYNLSDLLPLKIFCRPEQASYLYFTNFALSVLEHDVLKADVFVSFESEAEEY